MALTRTLAQLRTEARQLADMENSTFISDSEFNRYINRSTARLYGKLVEARGDQYYRTSSAFTVSGGSGVVALPTNFFKLLAVDLDRQSGSTRNITALELPFSLRNRVDAVPDGRTGTIWFVPHFTEMTSDSDTFDGINFWEHWVVLDVVIQALTKEESDTSSLVLERDVMNREIEGLSRNRNYGEPSPIQDLRRNNSRSFYSLEGSNIRLYETRPELLDFVFV